MTFQSIPVSGTTNVSIADELGQRFPTPSRDVDCLEASRLFVEKIVKEAQLMGGPTNGKREDMMRQIYRIEATLGALEDLQRKGLATPDAHKELLLTIVDMGQKFLSCHKEICQEVSERALLGEG